MRGIVVLALLAAVSAIPRPAGAYIAVKANRLTLCEVILEFPDVVLLEIQKSDPATGAYVATVREVLAGKKPEQPIRLALLSDGKLPERLGGLRPGSTLVAFFGSPDRRSLFLAEGGWFVTNPDKGWERWNQFRDDFRNLFAGGPKELADAVRVLQRGGSARVPIQPLGTDAEARSYVRYDADFPHRRWPALPPKAVLPDLDELRKLARGPSIPGRLEAMLHLASLPDSEPDLRRGLRDTHAEVRAAAAFGLGQQKELSDGAISDLAKALADEDRFAASFAAASLGRAGPRAAAAIRDLEKALSDRDFDHDYRPHRAAEAAEAILRIDPKGSAADAALKLLLSDRMLNDRRIDSEGTRTAAARSLGRCGPSAKGAISDLRTHLEDSVPSTRIAAAEAMFLVGAGDKDRTAARRLLAAEMAKGARIDRIRAIRATAAVGESSLRTELQRAATDTDPDIAREATAALRTFSK